MITRFSLVNGEMVEDPLGEYVTYETLHRVALEHVEQRAELNARALTADLARARAHQLHGELLQLVARWDYWRETTEFPETKKFASLVEIERQMRRIAREDGAIFRRPEPHEVYP